MPQAYIIDPPGAGTDTLAPATREILGLTEYQQIAAATENFSRIWFIIYQKSIDEYIDLRYPNHPHLEYLDLKFALQSTVKQNDVIILLYTRDELAR